MSQTKIYTDGSCIPTKNNLGAWVSIIFVEAKKTILKGVVENTTHNRMELTAAIECLQYLIDKNIAVEKIVIYTDSQYVAQIEQRKEKLKKQNFISGKGTPIQNADLVKKLIHLIEELQPEFVKVKAHQKKTEIENFNREADMLVRKLARKNF
ncbi:MAG: ribonuclease HI [Bacteroidetes bacterium]|nr:ribonuclease HI [Bacteroidota bacterium]